MKEPEDLSRAEGGAAAVETAGAEVTAAAVVVLTAADADDETEPEDEAPALRQASKEHEMKEEDEE